MCMVYMYLPEYFVLFTFGGKCSWIWFECPFLEFCPCLHNQGGNQSSKSFPDLPCGLFSCRLRILLWPLNSRWYRRPGALARCLLTALRGQVHTVSSGELLSTECGSSALFVILLPRYYPKLYFLTLRLLWSLE